MIQGIYSDQSSLYMNPVFPKPGDFVTLRIRIPKKYGRIRGRVLLTQKKNAKRYRHTPMHLEEENDYFYYFSGKIKLGRRLIRYHFEIEFIDKKDIVKYDAMGIVSNRAVEDFVIIPNFEVPEWSVGAIYYQIFVDRFFNADESNDVRDGEIEYFGKKSRKRNWNDLPDPNQDYIDFYGGDLKGVIEKLEYLKELGVEVIYLNPIFVSPSSHKYDTQDYEYIDPHFGVIKNDESDIEKRYKKVTTDKENLIESNELFKELVEKAHKLGIKIIIDGVFNHCGYTHKWMDLKNIYDGKEIKREYFHWKNENEYEAWWNVKSLPKLNYEDNIELWKYIGNIGKKWVKEYDADGWRLDVAADLGKKEETNIFFWRFFNKQVKRAKKDTIIFAEHYDSPKKWIEKRAWDSIMNYIGFMEPVSFFLTGMEKHNDWHNAYLEGNSEEFVKSIRWAHSQLPMYSKYIALNQLENHDHSRWLTRTTKKIGRLKDKTHDEAEKDYDIDLFKMGILMLFTLVGSPGLYYGLEYGIAGWTDPDNRRTIPWNNFTNFNLEVYDFVKSVVKFYKESKVLRDGSFDFLEWNRNYLSYTIWNEEEAIVVAINLNYSNLKAKIPVWIAEIFKGELKLAISNRSELLKENKIFIVKDGYLELSIPERTMMVFKRKRKGEI